MVANIIGIIGTIASIIGAIVSINQSRKAVKAKDATLNAQKKIFKHMQFENFSSFKDECSKFVRFLERASSKAKPEGTSDKYVEDELEKFLSKFNEALSNADNEEREELEEKYNILINKRDDVKSDDKRTILDLLDHIRVLKRSISDIQMSNKLSV